MNINEFIKKDPVIANICSAKETVWINPDKVPFTEAAGCALTAEDIENADKRLRRFAPFIMKHFPETGKDGGIIESPSEEIENMRLLINRKYGSCISGRLFLKMDSHLAVAGSVKARGGIYEVLKHTETLARENGLIDSSDGFQRLLNGEYRDFFSRYSVQVGSTGNLGLSIGIMSAAVGYNITVHMSSDAKEWKKELLRSRGVTVKEYDSDYSEAVKNGRRLSDENPMSYFVDDENSKDLFLGYATAAKRLEGQLAAMGISVDGEHPLFVYLPCGVGGAPGGIAFGLKQLFKDNVHCFFAEPTEAPCMLLGLATGLHNKISVKDAGLSGLTHADGLAVGRPSGFVGRTVGPLLSGEFTVSDSVLYEHLRELYESENIFIEPSACAALHCPAVAFNNTAFLNYIRENKLEDVMDNAVHIAWATGGSLVPETIREEYLNTYL